MDEGDARPGLPVQVKGVQPGTAGLESHVLGAEAGRPAVIYNGESLTEGYVEAFGVDPQLRRRGVGTVLQQHAAQQCPWRGRRARGP
jgi:GNAT superfamily N-acetyltransferase